MAEKPSKVIVESTFQQNETSKEAEDVVWIIEKAKRRLIECDYKILKQIGDEGPINGAIAYKSERKSDGFQCAIKVIKKERIYKLSPDNPKRTALIQSYRNEIDVMRKIKHKYIVQLYDVYETKEELYIVVTLCEGGELFERIKQKRRYAEDDVKPIIKMLCESLFYLHEKHRIAHFDIKPDNILFIDGSETSDIQLIDFGYSKEMPRLKSCGMPLDSTPYYIAPELLNKKPSYSADMWAVGVVTYVMVFGFPPFYVDPNKYKGAQEEREIYKLVLKGFDPQIKRNYGPWFPKALSNKLSKDGMDFISNLLKTNISERLTAQEALQHPWLSGSCVNVDLLSLSLLKFAAANKFKYAIGALYAEKCKAFRSKLMEHLSTVIPLSTLLTYNEFEQLFLTECTQLAMTKRLCHKMCNALDIDKCGYIELKHLEIAFAFDQLISIDERLEKCFMILSNDDKEYLKISDAKEKLAVSRCKDTIVGYMDAIHSDNDEKIHYDEFLHAIHPDFVCGLNVDFEYVDENLILIYGYINGIKMDVPIDICNRIVSFYDMDRKLIKMKYVPII